LVCALQQHNFGILTEDWNDFVAASHEEWVVALIELITRGFDRVYYRVCNQIALKRGLDAMRTKERRWMHMWDSTARGKEGEMQSSSTWIVDLLAGSEF